MDRATAIEINHAALTRIVAALIAMAGLANDGVAARLPHLLYRAVWRVLWPAESAVRRLIVIAARGLTVELPPPRPFPKGLLIARPGASRPSFQLFDTRKRFSSRRGVIAAGAGPRVHVFGVSPFTPLFQSRPVEYPLLESDDGIGDNVRALHLGRRLAAIKMALENLPREVKRLVRWQARRNRILRPTFKLPPGYREESEDEIDRVLRTCHALARQALDEDTS
jgi:hypothetical protein